MLSSIANGVFLADGLEIQILVVFKKTVMRTAKTTSYRGPPLFLFVPQGDSGILVSDVGWIRAKIDGRFRRILIVIRKTPVGGQKRRHTYDRSCTFVILDVNPACLRRMLLQSVH